MTLPRGPMGSGTQQQNTRTSLVVPDNTGSLVFPTAKEVENFHRNSDADKRPEAIHHSLGNSHNKAAYGDHTHDGSTSQALIPQPAGTFGQNLGTFQGQKDAIKQILQLLQAIGALDSTTVSGSYPEIQTGTATVTWTAAGTASDLIAIAFSPAFSATPKVMGEIRSTAVTTTLFSLRVGAGVSTSGTSWRIIASASQSAGFSLPVDWIALNMKAYT